MEHLPDAATDAQDAAREAASGDGSDSAKVGCPETPAVKVSGGAVIDLGVDFLLNQQPLVIGESNVTASGLAVTPLDLRFYISDVALRTSDGQSVPVDLITSAGALEAYGVHLVAADDLASRTLHLRAAAGSYTGVSFTLGLSDACNAGSFGRKPPLNAASQMTWPQFGYLFLRYQAKLAGAATAPDGGRHDGGDNDANHDANASDASASDASHDAGASDANASDANASDTSHDVHATDVRTTDAGAVPMVIHMGGFPGVLFAPTVVANGTIAVPGTATVAARLRMNVDEMLKGASTHIDLTDFSGPSGQEVDDGEQLRQSAPRLMLFDLASP